MLKLAGPGLGPAWEGRTGNEAPWPGAQHFSLALEGGAAPGTVPTFLPASP